MSETSKRLAKATNRALKAVHRRCSARLDHLRWQITLIVMAYHVFFVIWSLLLSLVVYHLMRSNSARRTQFRGTTYSKPVSLLCALMTFTVVMALALVIRR